MAEGGSLEQIKLDPSPREEGQGRGINLIKRNSPQGEGIKDKSIFVICLSALYAEC